MPPLNHVGPHGITRDRQAALPDLLPRSEPSNREIVFPTRSELLIFGLRRKMIPRYVFAHYAYYRMKGWLHPASFCVKIEQLDKWQADQKINPNGHKVRWHQPRPDAGALGFDRKSLPNELHNPELLAFMVDEFSIPANEAAGYAAKVSFAWVRWHHWDERRKRRAERFAPLLRFLPSMPPKSGRLPPPKGR